MFTGQLKSDGGGVSQSPTCPPPALSPLSGDVCKLDKVRPLNPPATYPDQCVTEAEVRAYFAMNQFQFPTNLDFVQQHVIPPPAITPHCGGAGIKLTIRTFFIILLRRGQTPSLTI